MTSRPEFAFDRLDPPHLDDPYPLYARARIEMPVFYSPDFGLWCLTRHRDVRAALQDPQRFSSVFFMRTPAGAPPEVDALLAEAYPELPMLVNQDPPDHTRIRGLVNKTFLPQRMAALEPDIQAIADRRVDAVAGQGRADLVSALTFPLPMEVICTLIGLPVERHTQLKTWTHDLIALGSPGTTGEAQRAAAAGSVAFQRYLAGKIEQRRKEPCDDLLTALVEADGGALTTAELVNLLIILVFAGHETTTNLIGNTLRLLLADPDSWLAVRADPALTADAVIEGLRADTPVQGMFRTTTTDVDIDDVTIPADAKVLLLFGAANRDPEVFRDPDVFDLSRTNKDQHLGFGRGIHFCVGAALARMEARITINTLAERLPNLRLDPDQPPAYPPNLMHRGPLTLHAQWDRQG